MYFFTYVDNGNKSSELYISCDVINNCIFKIFVW